MNRSRKILFAENESVRDILHRQILDAISHDLKTPLAAIIGSLEVYEQSKMALTSSNKHILINTALMEAYRLDSFISNILDMAKLEGNRIKPRSESCNITALLNSCLLRAGLKRKACKVSISGPVDAVAITDNVLLGRAITAIIDNAVKHSGTSPAIDIRYGMDDYDCFIRIADNGPGIPEGKEKEIFNKYVRFEKADHQNAGTGLGLAICHHIMKLLSGSITAENRDSGKGAVFTLTFPLGHLLLNPAYQYKVAASH